MKYFMKRTSKQIYRFKYSRNLNFLLVILEVDLTQLDGFHHLAINCLKIDHDII